MANIPIGLQLYSIREDCGKDLPGTLKAVAEMGYEGVEFAGYHDHCAGDLRKMLDDLGLICCGTHTGLDTLLGDELCKTVEFNKTLGNPYLIVPGLPEECRSSRSAWQETARVFNGISEKVRPLDMWTGYHNHHVEFTELEGETPWDTFFGNTDKEVVMQLDTGNALSGGGDCVDILKRYPGRATTVHLKPYTVEPGREDRSAGFRPIIGEDDIPWHEVFDLCETTGGTEWYIVEYESDAYPPLEAVKKCLDALKAMGK